MMAKSGLPIEMAIDVGVRPNGMRQILARPAPRTA